jgi:hypothetical protein
LCEGALAKPPHPHPLPRRRRRLDGQVSPDLTTNGWEQ